MPTPPVQHHMCEDGMALGARKHPSFVALFCLGPCAISGYEYGDPTDGCMSGSALVACCLGCFCCIIGNIYSACIWKPDPKNILGDGTQRTVNNMCLAVCCVGGPCAISFWESGDLCMGLCEGSAFIALILEVIGAILGCPLGCAYACCCWNPNVYNFKRSPEMDGQCTPCGAAIAVKVGNGSKNLDKE